jgi:hypothetical protein
MAFLQSEAGRPTVAAALLLAPPFLSDLSDPELALLRHKVEASVLNPEIAEAKAATAKAMKAAEHGWQRVSANITARSGLEQEPLMPKERIVA